MAGDVGDIIKPLCWLIGKWISTSAKGKYPTIKPFEYCEELEFSTFGQPMLQYSSKTYMGKQNTPMHFETGFLRIKPCTNLVSLLSVHNFGITSIEEGTINDGCLDLKSINIGRMSFGSEPGVCSLERNFKISGDVLELVVYMATEKTPLTEHLRIKYKKVH